MDKIVGECQTRQIFFFYITRGEMKSTVGLLTKYSYLYIKGNKLY